MTDYLRISVTFLDRRFHGRGDGGRPEWPPSPLRLMQAIVAAGADEVGTDGELDAALRWLERQPPPMIIAPSATKGAAYCLSVPNNAMDLVGKAWSRGSYFGTGDSNPAKHRTMKTVRPMRLVQGDTVHYLWRTDEQPEAPPVHALASAAKRLIALGWGTDLVVGTADHAASPDLDGLTGEHWKPVTGVGRVALRIPVPGTLQALLDRHDSFVHRLTREGFVPVPPLTQFKMAGYRRPTDVLNRPVAIFELRHDDGRFCAYSQRKLIHIAGMVRHLAIERMRRDPPRDVDDPERWLEQYVRGGEQEATRTSEPHRRLSYLPLPSIGHRHADQAVRRIVITAPLGDDAWLEHLALRLEGRQLKPERGDEFGESIPPSLVRVLHDNVASHYTPAATQWASVTPVILPGHDDHKPAKTRRLIRTFTGFRADFRLNVLISKGLSRLSKCKL